MQVLDKGIGRATVAAALFTVAVFGVGMLALADEPFTRKPLQMSPFPAGHQSHIMEVVVAPGGTVPRHTHPGIEMGYVDQGELTLAVEGKPEQVLKTGDSYAVPAGAIHGGKNSGTTPAKLIAVFVVEAGKPMATPAP